MHNPFLTNTDETAMETSPTQLNVDAPTHSAVTTAYSLLDCLWAILVTACSAITLPGSAALQNHVYTSRTQTDHADAGHPDSICADIMEFCGADQHLFQKAVFPILESNVSSGTCNIRQTDRISTVGIATSAATLAAVVRFFTQGAPMPLWRQDPCLCRFGEEQTGQVPVLRLLSYRSGWAHGLGACRTWSAAVDLQIAHSHRQCRQRCRQVRGLPGRKGDSLQSRRWNSGAGVPPTSCPVRDHVRHQYGRDDPSATGQIGCPGRSGRRAAAIPPPIPAPRGIDSALVLDGNAVMSAVKAMATPALEHHDRPAGRWDHFIPAIRKAYVDSGSSLKKVFNNPKGLIDISTHVDLIRALLPGIYSIGDIWCIDPDSAEEVLAILSAINVGLDWQA